MALIDHWPRFQQCLTDSASYPESLIDPGTYDFGIQRYKKKLSENQSRLFTPGQEGLLEFYELSTLGRCDFETYSVKNVAETRSHVGRALNSALKDPQVRFTFLQAPNARSPLKTTKEMLMHVLTHHQTMPAFLDFVFPFGIQLYKKDFHFSGFQHETRISPADRGVQIAPLERSGLGWQLCYSLKSAETTKEAHMPWSIRQASIQHSFDIESGRATWIVLKANSELKKRVKSATQDCAPTQHMSFDSKANALAATLELHWIMADWSAESWRWYINYLEDKLQSSTRGTLSAPLESAEDPEVEFKADGTRTDSFRPQRQGTGRFSVKRVLTGVLNTNQNQDQSVQLSNIVSDSLQSDDPYSPENQEYRFENLQETQHLEEEANTCLLAIKTNIGVLSRLRDYYRSVADENQLPSDLQNAAEMSVRRFEKRITSIISGLDLQKDSVESLLKLLADRKALIYGILEFFNTKSNRHFSKENQKSAVAMEKMTREMNEIAFRTERETVSMRVVTLVTLFFLPAAFTSTFMSTDIVRYNTNKPGEVYSAEAMTLFSAICFPLMFLTFAFSWAFWLYARKTRRGNQDTQDQQSRAEMGKITSQNTQSSSPP